MIGPLSSFRFTTSPALPARAVVAATGARPGYELERAKEIARANGASLYVVKLERGERVLAVSDVADDTSARLVIVGVQRERSRTPFAEDVHDVAGRAILQVRNRVDGPYNRVVVAVDTSSEVREMMNAARFVAPHARDVELLHAYRSASEPALVSQSIGLVAIGHFRREAARDARAKLTDVLHRAKLDARALHLVHGPPALVLSSVPSDALLVVHRGHSWLKRAVFGSVTRSVLVDARADVLVV